jgi:hypothetical protein
MLWQNRMRRAILMLGSGGGQHELADTQPGQHSRRFAIRNGSASLMAAAQAGPAARRC